MVEHTAAAGVLQFAVFNRPWIVANTARVTGMVGLLAFVSPVLKRYSGEVLEFLERYDPETLMSRVYHCDDMMFGRGWFKVFRTDLPAPVGWGYEKLGIPMRFQNTIPL